MPGVELTAHFHNTRGQGLANVLAALEAGVSSFESSIGARRKPAGMFPERLGERRAALVSRVTRERAVIRGAAALSTDGASETVVLSVSSTSADQ